jgi:hypothetical protein
LKVLFRINLVLAILIPVAWFGFRFFLRGGCVIPIVTPLLTYICVIALLPAALLSPYLLIADLIALFPLWRRHGIRSLIPLALITAALLAVIPLTWIAHSLCNKRFERHLPQYEKAAFSIEGNAASDFRHEKPGGWMHLTILPPITYREDDGSLTVEFMVGGIGPPPRHTVYLYRPNGVIEKSSQTSTRWHWPMRVNEHWFRASN